LIVVLEQDEASSKLNGVVVLDCHKVSVIEIQRSSTHAAGSEIFGSVRDV